LTEIRFINDFSCTDVFHGKKYHMVTGDGVADVINLQFDEGFVINLLDFNTSRLVNQDRIGALNYMMIQVPLLGRMVFEESGKYYSMVPGNACIYYPPNRKQVMNIPTNAFRAVVIGLDLDRFRMKGMDGDTSREILETIKDKYRIGERRFFDVDDRIMVEMYALDSILEDPSIVEDDVVYGIVSDIFHQLFEKDFRWCDMAPVGLDNPEDRLYGELLKDENEGRSIESICSEIGIDRYSISPIFRDVYGDTPLAFMKHHRMLRSAGAILLGQNNMRAVSESAGYDTESKFASSFRKRFGCRPKHFREEFMKGVYIRTSDRVRTYHYVRPSLVLRDVAIDPVGLPDVLRGDDLLGRPEGQDPARAREHEYLVGRLRCYVHIVADHYDELVLPVGHLLQQGGDEHLRTDVQIGSGLVEDEDPRILHQPPCDHHLLILSGGQLVHRLVG